jgi:FAD/FMN-containing dehydrogenase
VSRSSACYPQFAEILALKRRYDPDELFNSDWYRHYATLFPAA